MTIEKYASELAVSPIRVMRALHQMGIKDPTRSMEVPLGYHTSIAKLIIEDYRRNYMRALETRSTVLA